MTSVLLAANDFVIEQAAHIEAEKVLVKTRDVDRLKFSVDLQDGKQLAMPDSVSDLLEAVLQVAAQGGKVTFTTLPSEMTSAAAASWLGISRPTLMKLIKDKKIPAHKTGSHTRVKISDLMKFREARLKSQKKSFADLRRISENF